MQTAIKAVILAAITFPGVNCMPPSMEVHEDTTSVLGDYQHLEDFNVWQGQGFVAVHPLINPLTKTLDSWVVWPTMTSNIVTKSPISGVSVLFTNREADDEKFSEVNLTTPTCPIVGWEQPQWLSA